MQSIHKGINTERKGEIKNRIKVVLYNYTHTHYIFFPNFFSRGAGHSNLTF